MWCLYVCIAKESFQKIISIPTIFSTQSWRLCPIFSNPIHQNYLPLKIQGSPTFLAPRTSFVENNFSTEGARMVSGWVKHMIFIVHFTSYLMLLLVWQEVPVCHLEVGDLWLRCISFHLKERFYLCFFPHETGFLKITLLLS